MAKASLLPDRAVLEIGGPEARDFLQNLVTNNVDQANPDSAVYTLLLTPQGKYLFDFFLLEQDGRFLADCDSEAAPLLLKRLMFYKLRADVTLKDASADWTVGAHWDAERTAAPVAVSAFNGGWLYGDPRLAALGSRFIVPSGQADAALAASGADQAEPKDYEVYRSSLGVPGPADLIAEKTFPLEANLDLLHAVDYQKGCFIGQEVTSRTHRQGKVRKRILPVSASSALPKAGTAIMAGERQAGELLSRHGPQGLALLRLDRLSEPLDAAGTDIDVQFPDWLPAPEAADGEDDGE